MKKIITISRQFGAGGGTIGEILAKRLGFDYIDKELVFRTARDTNLTPEEIAAIDEKVPSVFGFAQSLFDMYNAPLDERLFSAQKKIIQKIAEKGNCVIVGRNSNFILREYDNALHALIYANVDWRVEYLKKEKMQGSSEAKIREYVRDVDKARRKYCQYYTKSEFTLTESYDICLCTSRLGIEKCADILCALASER